MGDAVFGIEAEGTVLLLVDRRYIDQSEFVAHPDLVDLHIGMSRDGVLELRNCRDQYAVDIGAAALHSFPVLNVHHFVEQASEQNIPELDLSLPGFDQPVGLCAAFGLVKKLVLGESGGIDHAYSDRQRVEQWCGECAFDNHLLTCAPCAKQGEAKQKEPASYEGRLMVESR